MTANTDQSLVQRYDPPWSVRAYIGISWLLGWVLVLDGLYQRLWGAYLPLDPAWMPWAALVRALGFGPLDSGWPLICLGFGLIGSGFGLVARRRWGYNIGLGSALLALAYPYLGTVLGLIGIACLSLPITRRYVQSSRL